MLKKKLIKIQFVNSKTQFENAKTQKTAQVVVWTCLDRRTKKCPAFNLFLLLPMQMQYIQLAIRSGFFNSPIFAILLIIQAEELIF